MKWISVKDELPPYQTAVDDPQTPLVLLYHTVGGVGFGHIYVLDEGEIEQLQEEFNDKYICSFYFISSKLDGNYCLDILGGTDGWNDEDVFEKSPHDPSIGTITHWMYLPKSPLPADFNFPNIDVSLL